MANNPDHDRCTGREAARIVGYPWPGPFNRARRALERIRVRRSDTTVIEPYPSPDFFQALAGQWGCSPTEAEQRWRRSQILVVPEWGGVCMPGTDWTYSRSASERWVARLAAGTPE